MKAIFHKCYDDWGNLKDNALNIAYNLGKKEGLRKGKKIARAEVIDEFVKAYTKFMDEDKKCNIYEECCDSPTGYCIDCFKEKWLKEHI